MANKTLFKSLIGKLVPTTDALNEERAPAYALSPKHQLAQYAATGSLSAFRNYGECWCGVHGKRKLGLESRPT